MMFVTSKHVFEIKKCRNFLKDNDLLSAVSTNMEGVFCQATTLKRDVRVHTGEKRSEKSV